MRLADRYILRNHVGPFFLGLSVLTFIFLIDILYSFLEMFLVNKGWRPASVAVELYEVQSDPVVVIGAFTVMLNAANDTVSMPSLTLIVIPLVVPVSVLAGVPLMDPLVVLKVAQVGRLVTLKLRVSPSASLAVGAKL